MTFEQSVIASGVGGAIGAFIGFLGALMIFFLKENRQKENLRKSTIANLKLELAYNINLYNDFENKIQKCIEALSNKSRAIYLTLDYQFIGTFFAIQFYQSGLLLKYFHSEDMKKWNIMLTQIGAGAEKHVTDCVTQWREGKDIEQEKVYSALDFEKTQINYAKEMSQYLLDALQQKA